jgi:hypothetical protein
MAMAMVMGKVSATIGSRHQGQILVGQGHGSL